MFRTVCALIVMTCLWVSGCQQQQQVVQTDAIESEAKEILNRYLEIFNVGNMNLVENTIDSAHFVMEPNFPEKIVGRDGFTQWVEGYRNTFSDFNLAIIEMLVKDSVIVVHWTVTGTQDGPMGDLPPTGKKIKVSGLTLFRTANGRITEEWIYYDRLESRTQLGFTLVPPEM